MQTDTDLYQFAFDPIHSCRDKSAVTSEKIVAEFVQIGISIAILKIGHSF